MQNRRILSFAAFGKYLHDAKRSACTRQSSVAVVLNCGRAFFRIIGIFSLAGFLFTDSAYASATNCPAAAQGIYNVCTLATAGAGTSASPWAGWESRLNALPPNIEIYFTTGTYQLNATIVAKKGWTLRGAGINATSINAGSNFTGDMILWGSSSTINTSSAAYLNIKDLGLISSDYANARSAAIDIVGGTYVNIKNVSTHGFGIGIVLNQAEIVDIEDCDFEGTLPVSLAGIYLVNGNYNPSNSGINTSTASPNYTNRISISKNQFNGSNSSYIGVYDEGGNVHSIRDNNFNGGARAVYIVGVHLGLIEGNEVEGTQLEPIYIDQNTPNETWPAGYTHQSHDLSIRHNSLSMNVNKSAVLFATPLPNDSDPFVWVASVTDNALGSVNSSSIASLSGVSHVAGLVAYSNFNGYGDTPISDVGSVTSEIHGTISISSSHAINGPTNPPKGTFYLYVDTDNILKAKGANGTVTTLAIP